MFLKRRTWALVASTLCGTALYGTANAQTTWDMPSLEQAVQPMQHSLNGVMPLLPSSLPIPNDDTAITLYQNGTLAQYVSALWARGIALTSIMSGQSNFSDGGGLARAKAMQDAGHPVHIKTYLYGDFSSAPSGFGHNAATAFWPLNATPSPWIQDSQSNYWPAFPLATPTAGYNEIKARLQALATGGITAIGGLWLDYEDYPAYWVDLPATTVQNMYFSQYYTDSYAAGNGVLISNYPSNLLTNFDRGPNYRDNTHVAMVQYVYDLNYALVKQSARQALTDLYGATSVVGNYGYYYSTTANPYTEGWGLFPPTPPPETGMAAMPIAYADTAGLANDFTSQFTNPTQIAPTNATTAADYWYRMLSPVSSTQSNAGSAGSSVLWVSDNVPDNQSQPWIQWATMVPSDYKELLRHCWLRGVKGMYVFNRDPVDGQSAADSYNDLELARSVLDEVLSFRQFLTQGVPMNYAVNSSFFSGAVEWSGLSNSASNPTQWVVRTVSRTGTAGVVHSITAAPGLTFNNVPAPVDGATFILNSDASMHRVDSRPAALYVQFENSYQDSSGNNLAVVPGHNPSADSDPTFSTNVPVSNGVTNVLNGAYGLYANQLNQHDVSLTATPAQNGNPAGGNFVQIADANGIFNAASFTVETFVSISTASPDRAAVLSKGLGTSRGAYDWTLQYRTGGQLELRLELANRTVYYLRDAVAQRLTPGWHHVAFTYDATGNPTSPTVTLYIDHVKSPWASSSDAVLTGVLPQPIVRNSGDNLVVGLFGRGITATVDELRFTGEVLDPLQMLVVGALQ